MSSTWRVTTAVLATALLVAQAVMAVRGIIDSPGSAAGFGLPADDRAASFYHAVYRDRNLVIAVAGLVFLALRMWRALAVLATVAISLPLYDIVALVRAGVPVLPIHPATLVALLLLTTLLWLRVRSDTRAATASAPPVPAPAG